MRCNSCGDLVNVAVVATDGTPVAGCGMEGVLSKGGEVVPSVSYYTSGPKGDGSVVVKTLKGSDVKLGFTAAANLRPLGKILMSRVVSA